jgi:SAM-dependent methyltransferase
MGVLITSRSYAEYVAMFDLRRLPATVLDCCAGGSSFTAEANALGAEAIAADPVYGLPDGDLAATLRHGAEQTRHINNAHADDFVWSWYGSAAVRDDLRSKAARAFLDDKCAHPARYVAAGLPELPFRTGQFDLVLCSHLLFTWADKLDVAWHRKAITELLRVSRDEVRIFPLVQQGTGRPIDFLPDLLDRTRMPWGIRDVPFELQRGANQMLVLNKR